VCQNLAVAAAYSKSHGFNAITLEGGLLLLFSLSLIHFITYCNNTFTCLFLGDRIDNRGALSGGYHDARHSRLEAAKNMKKWEAKLQEEVDRGVRIKEDITRLDQEITKVLSMAQLADTKRRLAQDQKDPLALRLQAIHKERETLTANLSIKVRKHFCDSLFFLADASD
jgi:structural maintenance of chromosome 3 (chondroitin sulfate proteoglycan 6)